MPSTRLEVDGLTEAIKALSRFDKETGKEARDLLREGAKTIQKASQRKLSGRPGGGSYPRRKGMIGRSASQKGGGITLRQKKYPWAYAAEFGAKRAWVFGRVTTQAKLRRRQFPVWRGNRFVVRGRSGPGWIIQPAIRENIDKVTRKIADGLFDLLITTLNRAGVPRGRTGV